MAWSLCLALGLLAWPAHSAGAAQTAAPQKAPQKKEAAPAVPALPEYTIGPGDTLQLFVWKEPDLTNNVTVRIDGRITVPLLGDLVAVGKTSSELGREIGAALGRFVESPLVTVIVNQATSARIFMVGEVKNPGTQPLTARMTVLQALGMANGFQQFAKKDKILVIRERQALKVNYDKIEDGSDLSQNLVLQPGDTIIVP